MLVSESEPVWVRDQFLILVIIERLYMDPGDLCIEKPLINQAFHWRYKRDEKSIGQALESEPR